MAKVETDCEVCGGTGYIDKECPTCGQDVEEECKKCEGTGTIEEDDGEEE